MKKYMGKGILIVSLFGLLFLGACGFTVEEHEDSGLESTDENTSGTMLAGQEAPETVGTIKSIDSSDEIIITVEGEDITYRLSEDAKKQLESNSYESGTEVTFTTYTIGDDKETIDQFKE
ncbi:hypothetical protein [Ornithinibacillus xuwenensis]|uniref:Uncharacterized protein n=1 Tax=Ornithinibacillus xuwenensis TaxID=3144668 RepID=A0ABU9XHF7_9BACI